MKFAYLGSTSLFYSLRLFEFIFKIFIFTMVFMQKQPIN